MIENGLVMLQNYGESIDPHARRLFLLGMVYFSLPSVNSVGSFGSLALGRQPYDARGFIILSMPAI